MDVSSCRLVMCAIVGEKLEGFPKQDELKCVFVEHEIEEEEFGVPDDGFPILSVYERIRGLPVPPKGLRAARCAFLRTWTTRASERTARCTARCVFAR